MVEPDTFAFLTGLAANNRKVWVDAHRAEFDEARRNFTGIAMTLHDYADRFDPQVADVKHKPKQSYTKLYLEPRQRSGRALYRTSVDVFANAGHPEEDVGYLLHIEPGGCYAGAGLLQPSKQGLAQMRARLSEDPEGWAEVLDDPDFAAMFPDGVTSPKTLNVVPEGFREDDPAAPWLKMVGLGCGRAIPDEEMCDDDVIDTVVEAFRAAREMVRFFD